MCLRACVCEVQEPPSSGEIYNQNSCFAQDVALPVTLTCAVNEWLWYRAGDTLPRTIQTHTEDLDAGRLTAGKPTEAWAFYFEGQRGSLLVFAST